MNDISRRGFLLRAMSVVGSLAVFGIGAPIVRYIYPVVRGSTSTRQKVAGVEEVPSLPKVLDFDYQDTPCTLLLLGPGEYLGLSRICTHLGCVVSWREDEEEFRCPCHAGYFSPTGEVISGPPPRPLPRLKVSVKGSDIWVDGWESSA